MPAEAKAELRTYFKWFVEIIPGRVHELTALVRQSAAFKAWESNCTPESLNSLASAGSQTAFPWAGIPCMLTNKFFYPGFSAEFDETDWFVPPLWAGGLGPRDARNANGRAVEALLDHLTRAGMISQRLSRGAVQYHLTPFGFGYYFDDDNFETNRLRSPYFCYSRIVPKRIDWIQAVHMEKDALGQGQVKVFRAAFTWAAVPVGSWVPDDYLRAHSIVLGPVTEPAS